MPDAAEHSKPLLRFLTAGSVDDGKSTLIGRLLHDTRTVYEDQLENVRQASKTASSHALDLAFITDGLRAERERGITIDVAYRYFTTDRRKFIIADTPGHEQYTRNMATGASTASLALILVDVRKGVLPQTRRHACISWLLGIREVAVAVNKMDTAGYSQAAFEEVRAAFLAFSRGLGYPDATFIPLSALEGDNVVEPTTRMSWYRGPALLEYLETAPIHTDYNREDLRLPVQTVIRTPSGFRGYAGSLASGTLREGDPVVVLPSSIPTRIRSLACCDGERAEAFPPLAVTVELADEIDAGRGSLIVAPDRLPSQSRRFDAAVVWMAGKPLSVGRPYLVRHTTRQVLGEVVRLKHRLDIESMRRTPASELSLNDIGEVTLETHKPLFIDPYSRNRATGSFILIDPATNRTAACGMVLAASETALAATTATPPATPAPVSPTGGLTLWFTGLPSAGKTTLCAALSQRLTARGVAVEMLDGDVVRKHLSKGLGFSREDRDENIRRIGFVASLLTRNGVIVLVSAISPYRSVRDEVRAMIGNFVEVYVNAPLEVCQRRDVKGLYGKARRGELQGLTGVDDPYEPPLAPEIECRTAEESIAACVDKVLAWLQR